MHTAHAVDRVTQFAGSCGTFAGQNQTVLFYHTSAIPDSTTGSLRVKFVMKRYCPLHVHSVYPRALCSQMHIGMVRFLVRVSELSTAHLVPTVRYARKFATLISRSFISPRKASRCVKWALYTLVSRTPMSLLLRSSYRACSLPRCLTLIAVL